MFLLPLIVASCAHTCPPLPPKNRLKQRHPWFHFMWSTQIKCVDAQMMSHSPCMPSMSMAIQNESIAFQLCVPCMCFASVSDKMRVNVEFYFHFPFNFSLATDTIPLLCVINTYFAVSCRWNTIYMSFDDFNGVMLFDRLRHKLCPARCGAASEHDTDKRTQKFIHFHSCIIWHLHLCKSYWIRIM